ncbi:Protein of unknown function [Dyadobacter soli]|uniref:DUF2975 domain-containing protein n=1 Tax=Dyadobacter soli TaxID=659014 RepID=A0A1G7GHU8_9BACT|nr:DUF2975 domain-containing protein [Dyadobacter soli]SDE87738.1 Protein of unknown function [Dyadobacter soli]
MLIEISTKQILRIVLLFSWIIFVGLSIQAGAFLTNAVFVIVKPAVVDLLWQEVDLSDLRRHDPQYFFVIVLISGIVSLCKAGMFYLIIHFLLTKSVNMAQPFSRVTRGFVLGLCYLTFLIGLFSSMGARYAARYVAQGIKMPDIEQLNLGGADVWIFMAIILFVIAQIFRRGIEIQAENDLTI